MKIETQQDYLLHYMNEVILMGTQALWLTNQEKVEVESIIDSNPSMKYESLVFMAKKEDGSVIMIDRRDIILDEEQVLIDELADILYSSKTPVHNERYSIIMKQFIFKGVPYVKRLWDRKPQQQTLELFDAG
ncbi:hypothetical protein [Paenibacillus psychroresistens]|nr:hypothetical protein [Paenibacillus psychroresistens]